MNELLAVLAPLLLVDILNPVLFAFLIYAAGSRRPALTATSALLGHTAAYFLVGVAVAYGAQALFARFENPKPADYAIQLLVGLACLYGAFASRGGGASESRDRKDELSPLQAFGLGAVLNFIAAPFALPYFAAISQILDADISPGSAWLALIGYNLAYALPFALVPILVAVMGDQARPLLERINRLLVRGADFLMPWLILALGLLLTGDALRFYFSG